MGGLIFQTLPRLSSEAAAIYFPRREKLIRSNHGDAQIDNISKGLKSGKDLLEWLGRVQSHELASALPFVADLLDHQDNSVRRVAAETLCWFGDKRGFDFILKRRGQDDGFEWSATFQKVFTEYLPVGYNEPLVKLMREKNGDKITQKIDAYGIAEVLAAMGDPASLEVMLPMLTQYPPENADAVLALRSVDDARVIQTAKELLKNGKNSKVKLAAEIVLAAHGDQTAHQNIIGLAQQLTDLPQPQNADGTYKAGMKPAIGSSTPAWREDAVFALEQGMEYVPSALAVPVLKQIATNAKNVRFSETAILLLARIGDESARAALWETARAIQTRARPFEDTIFTSAGKALLAFGDDTSQQLAQRLFASDKHTLDTFQLLAESRGCDCVGLFNQGFFY